MATYPNDDLLRSIIIHHLSTSYLLTLSTPEDAQHLTESIMREYIRERKNRHSQSSRQAATRSRSLIRNWTK